MSELYNNTFLTSVMSIPSISKEEEKELFNRFRKGDVKAKHKLAESHLKFVVSIERQLKGYRVNPEELFQEGVVGLMKAIERFDHTLDIRLSTYCSEWIRTSMMEYIMRNHGSVIKLITTKAHKKVFFNVGKYRDEKGVVTEDAKHRMASDLGISIDQVNDSLERIHTKESSLLTLDPEDEDYGSDYKFNLYDDSRDPERLVLSYHEELNNSIIIKKAMSGLSERDRAIIELRILNEKKETLQSVSELFNISAERVRQLEKNVLKRLKVTIDDTSEAI